MKIEINYNRHYYKGDVVYIAFGFNAGIATKYYKTGNNDVRTGNLAFSNIFVNYIKHIKKMALDGYIGRTTTIMTMKSSTEKMAEDLIQGIKYFSGISMSIDEFVEVKKLTLENFKRQYKNGDFRARYKALEIADIVKGYTFDGLISDLANFEYEEFVTLYHDLIKCGICNIYVNGNICDLSPDELQTITKLSEHEHRPTIWCGKQLEPYLFDDAHIIEVARESCNVDVMHVSFDKRPNILDRFIWMTIVTERIPEKDRELNVDWYDASLLARTADVVALKQIIMTEVKEEEYKKAKKCTLMKYFRLLEKDPMTYAQRFLEMKNCKCDLNDYLQTLDCLEYQEYIRVAKKIRPFVTEAQVIMRRSVK